MVDESNILSELLPRYQLGDELGRGAWGIVWQAEHRTLHRRVAVKQLPGALNLDAQARDRFRSEARVVASLDHPHIVPVFDFAERDDTCVFVMELMSGGTLWDRFSRGEVDWPAACGVCVTVLSALAHAHDQGVLHRDVKPENVLFNANDQPKLADFGIAKVVGEGAGARTATGMIMGTPAYMAPEQGSGEPISPATDMYAVGAMLYELLSGRLPFESTGNPVTQLYRHVNEAPQPLQDVTSVPQPLADVVMRALEKAPADRHDSATAFASALDGAANTVFGPDWITRSAVRVLTSPLARPTNGLGPRPWSSAPPPPPNAPPPSAPPPSAPPSAPPQSSPASKPHEPSPAAMPRPRRLVWAAIVLAVLLVPAAIGGAWLAFAGGPEGPASAPTNSDGEGSPQPAQATEAAEERFRNACDLHDVPERLCTCALERSLDELTAEQFLANDRLLQDTGDGLTEEVQLIFSRCQDELSGSPAGG